MAEYSIKIPHRDLNAGGADMRSRLQTWEWRQKLPPQTTELVLDFSENQFVEPWALAQHVAYALAMKSSHAIPVRARLLSSNPANKWVATMGLDHVLETGESTPHWDESEQNTGLHVLKSHADVTRFVNSASRLGHGPARDTMDALQYGMAELGRNVVQHAASPIGGVAMAQFFPDRGAIQITVCDRGQGIRSSLSRNYPELKTDLEAAKLAVLPHASGATLDSTYASPDNAGLGLFFCKEIAWRADGAFWLLSDTALLGVRGADESGQDRIYRRVNPWLGTSVTMHFPSDGVVEFADLLELCQKLASLARNESGPAGLDFLTELPEEIEEALRVGIAEFAEDVEKAKTVRESLILPAIRSGKWVILDFENVRFATQSFVHALLYEAFRVPGSLLRLSFFKCTRASQQAIRTVAAYAATYRQTV